MVDTPKTFTGFLSTCAEAGPKFCAFAVPPGKSNVTQTTATLRARLNAIIDRLDKQPIVVDDSPAGPGIFTASNLQTFLLGALYSPSEWSGAMQGLASIEKGDATDAYTTIYLQIANISYVPYDNNVFNRSMQHYTTDESLLPILCGDTAPVNISVDALTDYFIETGKANLVGEQFAKFLGGCNGWAFRSSQRYTGPWTVAKGLKKTKFPILFMSLDADPVTPLSAAVNMSSGFGKESATLLIQQGFGHTTTAHPSLCTFKHVHDYFVDGKVPPNGTHCTPEPGFIYPINSTSSKRAASGLGKRDADLLEALNRLREARSKFNPRISGS
ncbi:hypothetical protein FRC07_012944 [Ceratobasidium sp. 392]|nr:hypothetical protein FRC07_012944 [Ceratobasidium sp. 392]